MTETLTVVGTLSRSFRLLLQRLGLFLGIALVFSSPTLVLVIPPMVDDVDPEVLLWRTALVTLAILMLTPIVTATVAFAVFRTLRGEPATLGDCLKVGFRRALPLVGLAISAGFLIGVGTLACIIPGIVLTAGLFVATPALVVERVGVFEAMSRSWQLTESFRGTLFLIVSIFAVANEVSSRFFFLESLMDEPYEYWTIALASFLASGIVLALQAISSTVAYHDLRVIKGGLGSEELAAAFD